jgi:hypothetical protein
MEEGDREAFMATFKKGRHGILTASGEARLTPLTDDAYLSSSLLTADHIATI